MLVYDPKTANVDAIDYREKAPLKASKEMFLDNEGNVDNEKSRFSHLSAGVPGTVAGMKLVLEKYGTMKWSQVIAPAILLAKKGFIVSPSVAQSFQSKEERLKKWPATWKIFSKNGESIQEGDRLVQTDLANTLSRISKHGPEEFYNGKTAKLLVKEMQLHGGLITMEDLGKYAAKIRTPISGMYKGYRVYSMPPPSSGGVHLIQMLNMLEQYDLKEMGHNSAAAIHTMAETMKYAYADRSKFLGDPDFNRVPVTDLTNKDYAKRLVAKISKRKARDSKKIKPSKTIPWESPQTTHFSVVDKNGMAVSNTTTVNFSFGSGIVVSGAGFLLNNEMDDFSSKPGHPNKYGLIGGTANAIEPEKRMLSSMTPTIVIKDQKPFMVTGSPGGSRIITSTLQVILNVVEHGMTIQEAVNAPRIHHQWLPDVLRVETGLSPDTLKILKKKGHEISVKDRNGCRQ